MNESEIVTLASLSDGAALERFDHELQRTLDNIADPNTDPKAVRTITLTVKIKPNDKRTMGEVKFSAQAKLAPLAPVETLIFIGRSGGNIVASEQLPPTPLEEEISQQTNNSTHTKIHRIANAQ